MARLTAATLLGGYVMTQGSVHYGVYVISSNAFTASWPAQAGASGPAIYRTAILSLSSSGENTRLPGSVRERLPRGE